MKKTLITFLTAAMTVSLLFTFCVSAATLGDIDGNDNITSDDAVYLLRYTLFPDYYPVTVFADFDHNGTITSDDAVYLLRYTLFPDYYPLMEKACEHPEESIVIDPAVEPTCTAAGKTEGSHCDICKKVLVAQHIIPALGHDYEAVYTAPTCTKQGYITHTCSRCGYSYADSYVAALGHQFEGKYCVRCGEEKGSEGLYMTYNGSGYSVTGIGYCSDISIVVPDTYNGLPVTQIADQAFMSNTSITSIKIPDSVTSIGMYAFMGCTNLVSVTFGDGISEIGSGAFRRCEALTEAVLPDSLTKINYDVFYACSNLAKVTLGKNVTEIGSFAFHKCFELKNISFGESLTTIKNDAFFKCTALTELVFPATLASIESTAFFSVPIQTVYYEGSAEQWAAVAIDSGNDAFGSAAYVYDYEHTVTNGYCSKCGKNIVTPHISVPLLPKQYSALTPSNKFWLNSLTATVEPFEEGAWGNVTMTITYSMTNYNASANTASMVRYYIYGSDSENGDYTLLSSGSLSGTGRDIYETTTRSVITYKYYIIEVDNY